MTTNYDYVYDADGRLEWVKVIDPTGTDDMICRHYILDDNNNRTGLVTYEDADDDGVCEAGEETGTVSGVYDTEDRMTDYGSADYEYRLDGTLESKAVGSDVTDYTYDLFGNLKSVDLPDGRNLDYLVDGMGRRVRRTVTDGASTDERSWLYQDALNPVAELDEDGDMVSRFVYGTKVNVPGMFYHIVFGAS